MHLIRRAILLSLLAALIPTATARAQGPIQPATAGGGFGFTDTTATASKIVVTSPYVVTDVDVVVHLHHAYPQDVNLMLQGPSGIRVPLISSSCGGHDNALATGTTFGFDDEAHTFPSVSGTCPEATYRPSGSSFPGFTATAARLSAYDGSPAGGDWYLIGYDDQAGDTGAVESWSLKVFSGGNTGDSWARPLPLATPDAGLGALTGYQTNQGATIETIPMGTGTVNLNEGTLACNGSSLGKSVWYSLHLPYAGSLRIDAAERANTATDVDYDAIPLDPILLIAGVDASGTWVGIAGGTSAFCANATGAGGTESITQHLAAGDYRVGVAGVRPTDFGSEQDNASDGLYQLSGAFTPDDADGDGIADGADRCPAVKPTVDADHDGCQDAVSPRDSDGDGILDSADHCPTVKPTVDADHDGCQDPNPVANALKKIDADVKYEWGKWRHNKRVVGAALTSVRIKNLPAGSLVQATCRGCRAFHSGKTRPFKAYKSTAKKSGDLKIAQLTNTLVPIGKRLVVVITRPGRIGIRTQIVMGRKRPKQFDGCLAAGSTKTSVACPVES